MTEPNYKQAFEAMANAFRKAREEIREETGSGDEMEAFNAVTERIVSQCLGENTIIHVVTFEGPGSAGFNWYFDEERADRAYQEEQETYSRFDERTTIRRFDVHVPATIIQLSRQDGNKVITECLSANDVYGLSENLAERTVTVGMGTANRGIITHPEK